MKKSKKIPKYNFGGLNDKDKTNVRNFLGNSFRATGDVGLSMLGMDNVIKDSDYKGNSAKGFMGYSDVMGGIGKSLLPAAANIVLPGSGTAIRAGQQVASSFNPEDNSLDKYDSNGNKVQSKGQILTSPGDVDQQKFFKHVSDAGLGFDEAKAVYDHYQMQKDSALHALKTGMEIDTLGGGSGVPTRANAPIITASPAPAPVIPTLPTAPSRSPLGRMLS